MCCRRAIPHLLAGHDDVRGIRAGQAPQGAYGQTESDARDQLEGYPDQPWKGRPPSRVHGHNGDLSHVLESLDTLLIATPRLVDYERFSRSTITQQRR